MPAHSHRHILASHPFTAGLAPEHLDPPGSSSSDRIDATGDFLCREGEAADSFFLIWKGRASLQVDASALRRLEDLPLR